MSGVQAAARLHDPVAHSHALGGFIAGAVIGIAAAAAVAVVVGMAATAIAAEVATAGLATPLVAGVAVTVGEFAVNAVVGGKLMGMAEQAGEALGADSMAAPSGEVAQGSPNVSVNRLAAARATDQESCDAGKIAEGSHSVYINNLPAARVKDKTTCGAVIVAGSANVFIGGPKENRLGIQPEVPEWARWAAVVAGILPALGGLARAIGPAIAEIEATGFARAAQTGVKALGRAMEDRAGGMRAPAVAKPEFEYNAVENPGPLATMRGRPAGNFFAGKYNMKVAEDDMVLYRGGDSQGNPLGQWFRRDAPQSVAQVRIDNAVKPQWIDPKTGALTGTSPIDAVYEVRIPKGTTYYEGPVGSQGGPYVGGMDQGQIFIDQPWTKGATVLGKTPLR